MLSLHFRWIYPSSVRSNPGSSSGFAVNMDGSVKTFYLPGATILNARTLRVGSCTIHREMNLAALLSPMFGFMSSKLGDSPEVYASKTFRNEAASLNCQGFDSRP